MGKGDGRRIENAAAIDANWERAFGRVSAHRCGVEGFDGMQGDVCAGCDDAALLAVTSSPLKLHDSGEVKLPAPVEHDARIARHLKRVLPLVYAQMEKELAAGWPAEG